MIVWSEILMRLSLAAFFGAMVGIERERKDWAAGLRTHMMVCVGASLIMIVSAFGFADILGTPNVSLDPSRIAAQVISGIGFIGAGTILYLRQEVIRGLTTAAGLWTVAGIGLATGGGMYFAATAATIIVIIILWVMKPVERKFFSRYKIHVVKIVTVSGSNLNVLSSINTILEDEKINFQNLTIAKESIESSIYIRVTNVRNANQIVNIVNKLNSLHDIKEIFWDNN